MTITDSPANYDSVHDDLIYTVFDAHSTDPVTYPNYKYILDIYVNGVMIARLRKVPNPDTNIGVFNIAQVVRSYLLATFTPTDNLQSFELGVDKFYVELAVHIGEEYSFTSFYNLVTSSTIKVYNNYNQRPGDNTLFLFADNVISNTPTTVKVYPGQEFAFIGWLPTTTTPVNVDVTTSLSGSYSTTVTPSAAFYAQILNLSPAALNTASPGLITAADVWYDVTIEDATYRFYLVCEPKYEVFDVHFLNRYGSYDSKLFNKVSRKTLNIQKSSFGVLPYTVDSSGIVAYSNGVVYNESQHTYASQYTEKLTLNSDILTDNEYSWLSDLIVSSQVFVNVDGYLMPCNITDNNYEPKKRVNDQLTNLVINIEFGRTQNAQFR